MDQETKITNYISIEAEVLFGETRPTYFVDVVTVVPGEKPSHSNIGSSKNVHVVRAKARELADEWACRVQDRTLEPGRHDYHLANAG